MTENQNKEQLKPTKEKTYNLKNDIIFQTFFARKGNEEFLIDFLNGLLKKDIKSIEIREEVNLEKHREYEVLTGIKWYFIELPKFRKQNPDMNEKINQWLAFIDDYDREMVKVAEEKNEKLKKARIEMNYLTGEAETRRLAELREKWEMDRVSAINHATRKGKEEKSIQIAKKLLKLNMPLEQIIEITELTKEEIENIKNK